MLKISLVRHAKSDWNHDNLSDFERPLNNRGLNDIKLMYRHLNTNDNPIWLSSSAFRTYQTSVLLAKKIGYELDKITFQEQLYHANAHTILSTINSISQDKSHLILVGHNNGISDFANRLCGVDHIAMPTCSIIEAVIEVNSWKEVSFGNAYLKAFNYPKMNK